MTVRKLKKSDTLGMSVDDAILALSTTMPKSGIKSVVISLHGKAKKGDYTGSDKLMAGSICWQLSSEGHSKPHICAVFDRHFTWVDTMIKKAVSSRTRFCDDQMAMAFLASVISYSDVAMLTRAFLGQDDETRKIAVKLFSHFCDKYVVREYQLANFFDHLLFINGKIKAPTTATNFAKAKDIIYENERAIRAASKPKMSTQERRRAVYSRFPFTFN